MKKFAFLMAAILFCIVNANAFEVNLLFNNKEAISRYVKEDQASSSWSESHLLGRSLKEKSIHALSLTFKEMERIDTNCEFGLIQRLISDSKVNNVIHSDREILSFIKYLRRENLIDDILYRLLRDSANIHFEMMTSENFPPKRPLNLYTRQNNNTDLEKLYHSFKSWPDDVKKCSLDTYYNLVQQISYKSGKDRDKQMAKLNYLAYSNKVIDLPTYNKLEVFRKGRVLDWPVYFKRYADLINNAKDKLTNNPELKTEHEFSVEYVSKREKLTQRSNLYKTYNSTQVMMLAQIIEKTAKRMDSKNVSLHWQYTDDPNGEVEVYIFSPMEQYRAAIKMLRKDMGEVMRSEAFRGKELQYEHLIAAAYETGFLRSEELDYVLRFEDFWNPKTPRWKAYANFAFSIAGTAVFYLPPPWNILGAIGLVLTQTKVIEGEPSPDADDNWNVII